MAPRRGGRVPFGVEPGEAAPSPGLHLKIAANLRLRTHREIAGPRSGSGSWVGYARLGSCAECDASPDSETLKDERGCPFRGLEVAAPGWRLDYTGDESDRALTCPVALRDEGVLAGISSALEVEALGGLGAVYGRPIFHLPERVVTFYRAALAARDRLEAEIADTARQLARPEAP